VFDLANGAVQLIDEPHSMPHYYFNYIATGE